MLSLRLSPFSASRPALFAVFALLAAPACSSDDDAGGIPARGSSPDPSGSQPATLARPEPDENGVRVRGGETGDFGSDDQPICIHTRTPISIDEARALGLPIDAQLASFGRTLSASLHYGPPSCAAGQTPSRDTSIELVLRPLQTYTVDVERDPNVITDDDCGADYLAYDAVVELATADGALTGTFYAPVSERDGRLYFSARSDVRNFQGTLQLPVDPARVHFATIEFAASVSGTDLDGSFQPVVTYVDGTRWEQALGGFAFFPAENHADDPFCEASSEFIEATQTPGSIALDAYPGSDPPATFSVRLSATAFDGARGTVELLVDGMPRQLSVVDEDETLDLGDLEAGTEIAVTVRNAAASGSVSVVVFGNDCAIASAGCEGECSADDTGVVAPVDCRGLFD